MKLKLHRMPAEARRMAHRAFLEDHKGPFQIAAILQASGYAISASSVDRYLRRIGGQLEQIELEAKTEALAHRIAELVVEKLTSDRDDKSISTLCEAAAVFIDKGLKGKCSRRIQ
jgi:hypothetical protein